MGTINKLKIKIEKVHQYGPMFLFWRVMNMAGLATTDKTKHYIKKYYLNLTLEDREEELKKWFFEKVGYSLDLKDPKTLDEKIQWLKLYDSTPLKTKLADKYLVREWVAEQIGNQYLIPLFGAWNSFEEIDFRSLPNQFVLKANHGKGMDFIVKNAEKLDMKKVKKMVDIWFRTDYGIDAKQEWHYLHTQHKVLAEQYIGTDDSVPADYKVYCFNGVPTYIQLIEGRFDESKQLFLNTNWEAMPFYHTEYRRMNTLPDKPKQLNEMLRLSEKLAQGFALVRVDWYLIGDEDIYFGEMTFTPASGIRQWVPEGTDEMLGDLITLPKEKYIVR